MKSAMGLIRENRIGEATAAIQKQLQGTPSEEKSTTPSIVPVPRKSRPLAEALEILRDKRPPAAKFKRTRPPKHGNREDMPEGAAFLSRTYASQEGSRDYKLYVPRTRLGKRPPLLVMLHGCNQDPDDFGAGTRMNALAERHGMIVVYPGQPTSANISACWNWFNPAHQVRGSGEPAIIAGLSQSLITEYNCDPSRVFVAGLSAGGAMAVVMGACYPDIFSGVGVHSGLAYQAANDVISAFEAMRGLAHGSIVPTNIRTIVFHGDADMTVHSSNGAQVSGLHITDQAKERIHQSKHQSHTRVVERDDAGRPFREHWILHGGGHAWSGGSPAGSYTARGPDASHEMLRFFLADGHD